MDNTKRNVSVFLLIIFSIAIVVCYVDYHAMDRSYESAEADYRYEKNHDTESRLNEIKLSRNRDIVIGYGSGIGIAICLIILYSFGNYKNEMTSKTEDTYDTSQKIDTQSTQSKLTELKSLYEAQLITEDEYNQKRKELLDKM